MRNNNNIKARLVKFNEMSWEYRAKMKQFMALSRTFDKFDPRDFEDPTLQIAEATNAAGEPICFAPVQKLLLVRAFAINPHASAGEAQAAGNSLDVQIATHAQLDGVSKVMIVVPDGLPTFPDHPTERLTGHHRMVEPTYTHRASEDNAQKGHIYVN